jgi:hypothetical protein
MNIHWKNQSPKVLIIGLFIILFPFIAIATESRHKEQIDNLNPEQSNLSEIVLSPTDNFSLEEVTDILQTSRYKIANLKGELTIANDVVTDYLAVNSNSKFERLDKELISQRLVLLKTMTPSQNISNKKDRSQTNNYNPLEIDDAINRLKSQTFTIEEISIFTNNVDEKEDLIQVLSSKSSVKNIVEKRSNILENDIKDRQSFEKNSLPTTEDKVMSNKTTLQSRIIQFLTPIQKTLASTPNWVPDFISIAFFDTDEIGVYPFEWWNDVNNATTYERPDAVSHWWRTHIIHRGTNGIPYIGKFNDEQGNNFSGWQQMNYPFANTDKDHSLTSHNNRLYHGVRGSGNQIFIRSSWDAGATWSEFRSVGRTTSIGFDMVSHNGKLCLAHKGNGSDQSIYVGCATDGWWDWSSVTWYKAQGVTTNMQPALASTFGSLWLGHTGTNNYPFLASSYNNGVSWSNIADFNSGRKTYSPISLVGIGSSSWQNERLCSLRRGDNNEIYQKCLFRYGPNYNQWNWHPWLLQQGQTNDVPIIVSDTSRISQVHRTLDNKIQSRTMEWVQPGGRGYISHMLWNENPGFGVNNGYEQDIFFSNTSGNNFQTYISKNDSGLPHCEPYLRYWASNLPDHYLDTRLDQNGQCDSSNSEVSYTIGSANADLIQPNKYYFTYWNDYKGERNIPVYKLQTTKTKGIPWGCANVMCLFTDELITPIPFDTNPDRVYTYPYWYKEWFNLN